MSEGAGLDQFDLVRRRQGRLGQVDVDGAC
jgi:hypothetical protein